MKAQFMMAAMAALLAATHAVADSNISGSGYFTRDAQFYGAGAYVPLHAGTAGNGDYQSLYLKANTSYYTYQASRSGFSYRAEGTGGSLGLGVNRQIAPGVTVSAGLDADYRDVRATQQTAISGQHVMARGNASASWQWSGSDTALLSLSYAPRFSSHYASLQTLHTLAGTAWYVGPQLVSSAELDYRSSAAALVFGRHAGAGGLGFSLALGVARTHGAFAETTPYASFYLSQRF